MIGGKKVYKHPLSFGLGTLPLELELEHRDVTCWLTYVKLPLDGYAILVTLKKGELLDTDTLSVNDI